MAAETEKQTGVVERGGELVFQPAPPAARERLMWGALWISGPLVALSSLYDAINGNAILVSLITAGFIITGGALRVRANLQRKRDPHRYDPIPLPRDLLDQVRGLNAMRGNGQAIRLIRDKTGLGLADAVAISAYAQKHPPVSELRQHAGGPIAPTRR